MLATATLPIRVKPSLRGVSHQIGFFAWLVAGSALVAIAPRGLPAVAATVHALCLAGLLGASALYHRPMWQPETRKLLRRLDHSAIFLLIAGTYTPVCLLALPQPAGQTLLAWIWGGAAFGIFKSLLWPHAPRPLTVSLYLGLGWAVVSQWGPVAEALGTVGVSLLIAGGVMYSLGALVYARRWPDPRPATFGYHEIFHVFVLLAAACHTALVLRLVHGVA